MDSELISGLTKHNAERSAIRQLFIASVVVGSLFAFSGTLLGNILVAIGGTVFVMCIYIILAYRMRADLPNNIIGDSFYYLGFILTLVALTASLISLTDDSVSISKIVGSFGAAMMTTIIGLIARLVVTTFSIEAAERREQIEQEIEISILQFSQQLDKMTNTVIADMVAMTTTLKVELLKTVDEFGNLSTSVQQTKSRLTSEFEESVHNLLTRINNIKVDPEIIQRTITSALSGFASEMSRLSQSYDSAVSAVADVNTQLTKSFADSQLLMTKTQAQLASDLENSVKSQTSSAMATISDIGKQLIAEMSSLSKLKVESDSALENLQRQYTQSIDIQQAVVNHINQSLSGITQQYDTVIDQSNKQVARIATQQKGLVEADSLLEKVSTSLIKISSEIEVINRVNLTVNQKLTEVLDEMITAVVKTRQMTDLAGGDLKSVYIELSSQIKFLRSQVK